MFRSAEDGSGRGQAYSPTLAQLGKRLSPAYSNDDPLRSSLGDKAGLGLELPSALHGVPASSQLDEPSPLLHFHVPSAQHEAPSMQAGLSPIPGSFAASQQVVRAHAPASATETPAAAASHSLP